MSQLSYLRVGASLAFLAGLVDVAGLEEEALVVRVRVVLPHTEPSSNIFSSQFLAVHLRAN